VHSVRDAEVNTCKTNMSTIANAVQAEHVRTKSPYFEGTVDAAAAAADGALSDLHNAVPHCPAGGAEFYTVEHSGDGFTVRCGVAAHTFIWRNGGFVDN